MTAGYQGPRASVRPAGPDQATSVHRLPDGLETMIVIMIPRILDTLVDGPVAGPAHAPTGSLRQPMPVTPRPP